MASNNIPERTTSWLNVLEDKKQQSPVGIQSSLAEGKSAVAKIDSDIKPKKKKRKQSQSGIVISPHKHPVQQLYEIHPDIDFDIVSQTGLPHAPIFNVTFTHTSYKGLKFLGTAGSTKVAKLEAAKKVLWYILQSKNNNSTDDLSDCSAETPPPPQQRSVLLTGVNTSFRTEPVVDQDCNKVVSDVIDNRIPNTFDNLTTNFMTNQKCYKVIIYCLVAVVFAAFVSMFVITWEKQNVVAVTTGKTCQLRDFCTSQTCQNSGKFTSTESGYNCIELPIDSQPIKKIQNISKPRFNVGVAINNSELLASMDKGIIIPRDFGEQYAAVSKSCLSRMCSYCMSIWEMYDALLGWWGGLGLTR